MTTTCVAARPDCPDCVRWNRCNGDCDDLCRMKADLGSSDEGHAAWHKAHYCYQCGAPKQTLDGQYTAIRGRCKYGNCTELRCPSCGGDLGGDGPVFCPCNSSWFTRFLFLRAPEWLRRAYFKVFRVPA
jgi:hypothetical protein